MRLKLWLFFLSSLISLVAKAQIKFSLQLAKDGITYIVYAKPAESANISSNTITGTGQVTIITPNGFQVENVTDLGGEWDNGGTVVRGPAEDPTHDYISFGLVGDTRPRVEYKQGMATALFSFQSKQGCQGTIRLIDNEKDTFAMLPNSINSNPSNEIGIIDLGNNLDRYRYTGNEAPYIANCANNSTPLFEATIEILSARSVAIQWASNEKAMGYEIRTRLSNTDEWLTSTKTREAKAFLYVPTVQIYEYQIMTKLMDGTTEQSDIFEVNLIGEK